MFRMWLDQPGVPADFRARYQNGSRAQLLNRPEGPG
jgi:hypothetical protein